MVGKPVTLPHKHDNMFA